MYGDNKEEMSYWKEKKRGQDWRESKSHPEEEAYFLIFLSLVPKSLGSILKQFESAGVSSLVLGREHKSPHLY